MRLFAVMVALAVSLANMPVARAEPSFWDTVREPKLRKSYAALVDIERAWRSLASEARDRRHQDVRAYLFRHALLILRLRPEELPDARLKLVAAHLLISAGHTRGAREGVGSATEMLRAAKRLLEQALTEDPDGALSAQGWFNLGIVSALLADPEREHEGYTRALELETGRSPRATAYYNRGDTSMLLGKLDFAIADYRRAIATHQDPRIQALAHWGLSLALERSGNLPSALEAARKAASILPLFWKQLLEHEAFFVPAYDLYYYKALTSMALARSAEKLVQARDHYQEAIDNWSKYLDEAQADNPPWTQNALLHRQSSERDLRKVQAKLAKEPPAKREKSFQFEIEIPFQWPPVPTPPSRSPLTP